MPNTSCHAAHVTAYHQISVHPSSHSHPGMRPAQEPDMAGPTFGELEQKRVDGTGNVGAAARKAAELAERRQRKHAADFKRENRHRPSEVSSKKPVGRYREVIQVPSR